MQMPRQFLAPSHRFLRDIAAAIEDQDVKLLAQLPGIGPATAERIVAKLRRKVPKFALMAARVLRPLRRAARPAWPSRRKAA